MMRSAKSAKDSSEPSPQGGAAKKVAPASATGNKGGRFENRVQATKLLAMCTAGPTAGLPDDTRVVELRFQARVHGRFTDDLVCTVENRSGVRSRALMQMKSGLTARKSNASFTEAVGNAWLDFQAPDFAKGADVLMIVFDMTTKAQMRGAEAVATVAKSSLTSADWLQKLLGAGAGNEPKRIAHALIKAACELYATRECSPDELHVFLTHVHFIAHDLDSDATDGYKAMLQQIQTVAPGHPVRPNPALVWSKLVTVCMELNEHAGAVDLVNVKDFIGSDLADLFSVHRSMFAGGVQGLAEMMAKFQAKALPSVASTGISLITARPGSLAVEQDQLPVARDSSVNKFVSGQLDHINAKIKATQYAAALEDIEHLGQDQSGFDAHQKARWHLLRGVCYWHLHGPDDAAAEFLNAAELCEDDDKLAAARPRAHLLRKEFPQAIATAQSALARFPNSQATWLVLANAHMNEGRALTEADIPAVHRGHADPLQLVAWSLKAQGNDREAAAVALKALTLADAGFFVAYAALSITLENAAGEGLRVAYRMFDDTSRADLARAVDAFEPREEKLWRTQSPETVADAAARLGMAYVLLGRPDDAFTTYQESLARKIKNAGLYRLGMEALIATGQRKEALALGSREVGEMPAEALVTFGQLAADEGDADALGAALESARARGIEERAVNALQALRWAALVAREPTKEPALQEIRAHLPAILSGSDMALIAICGRVLREHGRPGEADVFVERATELVRGASDDGDIYLAAMLAMQAKRFAQAAELLDRVLVPGVLTELHGHRLHALLRSGQLGKARDLVKGLPEGWELDDDVRHLAMELGQRAADWDFLSTLVDPQIKKQPGEASSWTFKVFVAAHRPEANMQQLVGDIPESVTGSNQDIARLAGAEMMHGDRDKAMRRLYRMRRSNLEDSEAAALYLAAHMMPGGELPLLHSIPDTVGAGTSVVLQDGDGNVLVRTIDPADCQVASLTEEFRLPASEDVRQLLGLHVGEKLVIHERLTLSERVYDVMAIENAYQRLLALSSQAIKQSLTPSGIVTVMNLEGAEDGDMDFSELERQLQAQSEHAREVFQIYRTTPITLGGVAKLLARDVFEVVRGWQQQDVPLFVGGGSPHEREVAAQLLNVPKSAFVVDAATLTELATIDCLDTLALLPRVLVATSTLDLVALKLADARLSRKGGTAFAHEGKLGFSEFTDQQRAEQIRFFERMQQAIERYCKVLPAYGPDDLSNVPAEFRRVVSSEEFAVVMLCLQEGARLFCMDARLRNLAGLFGVPGVWPQVLLSHAVQEENLTMRDYSVACLKMFFANRSFISLGDTDMMFMTYQGEDWLAFGIKKFAHLIAEGDIEFNSAFHVGVGFLGGLFQAGNCQFGVISQLLGILISGLSRHRQRPADLRAQVTRAFTASLGNFGRDNASQVASVVHAAFAGTEQGSDLELRASVLRISSPPTILVRKKARGKVVVDGESAVADAVAKKAAAPGTGGSGTSASPDCTAQEF
jgi:tetratricopeptide (TPR) repeat protein